MIKLLIIIGRSKIHFIFILLLVLLFTVNEAGFDVSPQLTKLKSRCSCEKLIILVSEVVSHKISFCNCNCKLLFIESVFIKEEIELPASIFIFSVFIFNSSSIKGFLYFKLFTKNSPVKSLFRKVSINF